MVTVPTETQSVAPMPYQSGNAPALAFGIGGQGLAVLGEGMQRAGSAGGRIAAQMRQQDDEAAVREADTRLSETLRARMFDPENGFYSTRGKVAFEGLKQVSTDVDAAIKTQMDGLATTDQKRMFADLARRRRESEIDGATRYALRERGAWLDGVNEARMQSAIDDGVARYNSEPDRVRAYHTGLNEILDMGQRNGWSPEAMQLKARDYASAFYAAAVERAAVDDPVAARDLMTRYRDKFTPQALGQLDRLTRESSRKAAVAAAVSRVLSTPTETGQDAVAVLAPLVMMAESGGDQGAVSPKGAIGIMQVMPETAREMSSKLGMPYDESRLRSDAEYNHALGSAYLKTMLERYGGNYTLAVAAYNAGPARVDEWVKTLGDPRGGAISDADFAAEIPFSETRSYVSRVLDGLGDGATNGSVRGLPPLSAQLTAVGKIKDSAIREDVRREVIANYDAQVKARKASTERIEQQALAYIDQGGSVWELRPDVRLQIGEEGVSRLRAYREARIKDGEPRTDWAFYETLRQESVTDPKSFLARSPMEVRPFAADAEFKEYLTRRDDLLKGKDFGAGTLDQQTGDMFDSLGLKDKAARGRLSRQVGLAIDDLGERLGRKPTFDERQKVVDRLAIEVSKRGWVGNSSGRLSGVKSASDLPKEFVAAFRARVPGASDQDVLDAFFQMNLGGQ